MAGGFYVGAVYFTPLRTVGAALIPINLICIILVFVTIPNECICFHGTGTTGDACPAEDDHVCHSCDAGYVPVFTGGVPTACALPVAAPAPAPAPEPAPEPVTEVDPSTVREKVTYQRWATTTSGQVETAAAGCVLGSSAFRAFSAPDLRIDLFCAGRGT